MNRINTYQVVFIYRKNNELRDHLSKEVFTDFPAQFLLPYFPFIELCLVELCQIPVKLNKEYEF